MEMLNYLLHTHAHKGDQMIPDLKSRQLMKMLNYLAYTYTKATK